MQLNKENSFIYNIFSLQEQNIFFIFTFNILIFMS